MNWKRLQPVRAGRDIALVLGCVFVATWPNILTNLLSGFFARGFQIATPPLVWSVMAAVVASLILYALGRFLTRSESPLNSPARSEENARIMSMQGGMLTLGIALSQACQGMFSGPMSQDKLVIGVLSLIPAMVGAAGVQIVQTRNNEALHYLDAAIHGLVMQNPHVNERMILEHAKGLAQKNQAAPFDVLSQKEISELVRLRMAHLTTRGDLNRTLGKDQRLSIVSFHDPNQWRIEKKDFTPPPPVDSPSVQQAASNTEDPVETDKIERLQNEAWKRWRSNYMDRESLRVLLEEEYHTPHGLSSGIKLEVSIMINHILSSVIHQNRDMTSYEQEKLMILNKLLGEDNL